MSSKTTSWPLILIAVAMTGAGVSYHFTVDSRFAALEQKLDQNSVALQQFQIAQESAASSKNEALSDLNKEVDALQSSLAPLGKANKDQTDAQKKLADYAGQLEKIKHDVQMRDVQASTTAPTAPVPPSVPLPATAPAASPAPTPAPVTTPTTANQLPAEHLPVADSKPIVAPHADTSSADLRPADITAARVNAVRALPVALPVDASLSDNR